LAPQLLAACEAHGQLRIWVRQGLSDDLFSQVASDELDMALCYEVAGGGTLESFPLCSEDLFLVGAPAVVDASAGPIDFRALAGLPLVLDERFHASRRLIETVASESKVKLNVSHEIEPINLKRELLIRHNRCSIVPYGLFLDEIADGQLNARRIVNPSLSRTLFLVVRRGMPRDTTATVLEMLTQLVNKLVDRGESGWRALADEPVELSLAPLGAIAAANS
jgi:LysR family nitrogen assimilation transcriptional regulator